MSSEDSIRIFDSRLLRVDTFHNSESSTVGKDNLKFETYESKWNDGIDVGFAFNQAFSEHSLNCSGCQAENEKRTVTLDGKPYKFADSDSDFSYTV